MAAAPARAESQSREAPSHSQAGGGGGRRRRERLCRRLLVPSADLPPPPPSAAVLPLWSCRGPPCSRSCPAPRQSHPRQRERSRPRGPRGLTSRERGTARSPRIRTPGSAAPAARGAAGGRAAPGPGRPRSCAPAPPTVLGRSPRRGRNRSLPASQPQPRVFSTEGSRVRRGGGESGAGH